MKPKPNPEIVELRTPLPLTTWQAFVSYKGPRRLSWPEVLQRAVAALLKEEAADEPVVPETT